MKTYFAPPERLTKNEAIDQYNHLVEKTNVINIIQSIPEIIVILNKFRQIIFANNAFLEIINVNNIKEIIGLRPGEAIKCIYSTLNKAGCGTSKFCKYCGAVNAILTSIKGKEATDECKILTQTNRTLILRVKTTPVEIDKVKYTLFTIRNIEEQKAIKVYQKVLFMDLNEMFSEILIASEVLQAELGPNPYIETISSLCQKSIKEINTQKLLIAAENNEIKIFPINVMSLDFLKELILSTNFNVSIEIDEKNSENIEFETDLEILRISIENLLLNFTESVENLEKITIGSNYKNNKIKFWIKSTKFISPEIQYKIFMKNLNVKSKNLGIEMYLSKILIEWYLNGKIALKTDKEKGTTFEIELPKELSI